MGAERERGKTPLSFSARVWLRPSPPGEGSPGPAAWQHLIWATQAIRKDPHLPGPPPGRRKCPGLIWKCKCETRAAQKWACWLELGSSFLMLTTVGLYSLPFQWAFILSVGLSVRTLGYFIPTVAHLSPGTMGSTLRFRNISALTKSLSAKSVWVKGHK